MEGSEGHAGESPLYDFDYKFPNDSAKDGRVEVEDSVRDIMQLLTAIHKAAIARNLVITPEPRVLVRRIPQGHGRKLAVRVEGFIHRDWGLTEDTEVTPLNASAGPKQLTYLASLSEKALEERTKRWREWVNNDELDGLLFPPRDQVLACIDLGVRVFPLGCLPQLRNVPDFGGISKQDVGGPTAKVHGKGYC
ncbi:hypothetical protein C8R46DRAFT_1226647 [Mycena filopes]|nr:hypothetical protein C8R46DRAFT_1226647 [Mycena filopes]